MAQREEITIGNATFYVAKFSAMEQLRIFGDLQKTILPSLGKLLGGLDVGKTESDNGDGNEKSAVGFEQFSAGLADLSTKLSGDELVKLTNTLISAELVSVERDDLNNGEAMKLTHNKINAVFDDMADLIELLVFILKLNFSSFFTKWLTRFGSVQKLKAAL